MDDFKKGLNVLNELNLNNKKTHQIIKKMIETLKLNLDNLDLKKLITNDYNYEIFYILSIEYYKQGYIEKSYELLIFIDSQIENLDNRLNDIQNLKFRVNSSISTINLIKWSNSEIKENDKNFLLQKLKNYFNKSDLIDMNEKINFITKGFYYLINNEIILAKEYFLNAKELDENYLPNLISFAIIKFIEKNWNDVLFIIKKCLKLYKNLYPELRLVLFICYFNLLDYEKAILALETYEKINNKNDLLYLYYALVYYKLKDYDKYFENLEKSFELNNKNPITIYYLSLFYLYKRNFNNSKKLLVLGITKINNILNISLANQNFNELKSKYFFLIGFINQTDYNNKNSLEKAYMFYNKSLIYYPNYDTHYNLAKLYLFEKRYDISLKHLEKINTNNFYEITRFKAYLYLKLNNKRLAIQNYEKILKYYTNDLNLNVELAEVKELNFEYQQSNSYYRKALELINIKNKIFKYDNILFDDLENDNKLIEISILNNLAINKISKKEDSIKILNNAIEKLKEIQIDKNEKNAINTILFYNLSILYEKLKDYNICIDIHNNILSFNPGFIESLMRIAWIEFKKNNWEKSLKLINEAIEVCKYSKYLNRIDYPISLKAYIYYKKNEFIKSWEELKLINHYKIDDTYSNILSAAIYYNLADYHKDKPNELKKYIKSSALICNNILKKRGEKNNYYSALISSFLFFLGNRTKDCNLILTSMNDKNVDSYYIKLNLAYLESKKNNFEKSNTILKNLKPNKNSIEKILIISSINYIYLNEFKKSNKNFKLLIKRNPNLISYYNFSTYIYEKSLIILKQLKKSIDNLKQMLFEINISKQIYNKINQIVSKNNNLLKFINESQNVNLIGKCYFNIKKLTEKQNWFINQNLNKFQDQINIEKEKLEKQKISQNNRKMILENKKKEEILKVEEEKLRQEKIKKEMEEKALEAFEKVKNLKNIFTAEKENKPIKKKKSDKKDNNILKKREIKDEDDEELSLQLSSKKSQQYNLDDEEELDEDFDENLIDNEKSLELGYQNDEIIETPEEKEEKLVKRKKLILDEDEEEEF